MTCTFLIDPVSRRQTSIFSSLASLKIFNLIIGLPVSKTSCALVYSLDQVLFQTASLFGINLRLASCRQDQYSLGFQSMLDHQLVILTLYIHKSLESNKPMEQTCHSCQYQVTLKCNSKFHKKAATEDVTDLVSIHCLTNYRSIFSLNTNHWFLYKWQISR